MSPRKVLTGLGTIAGLLGTSATTALTPATSAIARPAQGQPPLPPGDRFAALPESSASGLPAFAQGTVSIGAASDIAPAQTRIDAYYAPDAGQALVPLAYTFTDPLGRFALRALPGRLADGQLHTVTLVTSSPGGAVTTDKVQVAWDRSIAAWTRTSVDGGAPASRSSRRSTDGGGLRLELPDAPASRVAPSTTARQTAGGTTTATSSTCRPVVSPGAIIPLPAANITTGSALVQPKLDKNGNQAEPVSWDIENDYLTANSTFVERADNVSLKADFSATFGSVKLGVSGESVLSGSVSAGDEVTVNNYTGLVTSARAANIYGLDWRAWAQLYECIDIPRTYATQTTTYANAYLSLELADLAQSNAVLGQTRTILHRLDVDPQTHKYVRPCGDSTEGVTYQINPGGGLKRSQGSSQSFENGSTFKLGASVGGVMGSVQGSRTRSKKSRVSATTHAFTSWTNKMNTTKYLCGYTGNPGDRYADPGFVVALGGTRQ
ncbi:hypothetical protein KSP35_21895 [Aquihabitans sp. G128]|uniref:hypothetical protein n=1 Tax=Aquihabitans sp. G128 TaxID=2849779 RepID=UPI001C235CCE|nr:hypothetical protein [Aquihabitans sp. G128]QXC60935.1 hypothetical protein KSP35_21895 [Aquihabitans sp. G128]